MGKIKVFIHPLFYLFGIYYAIIGEIATFVIYTAVAIIHELGHSLRAESYGYKLNRITLMPFGAVVTGETKGLKLCDQIRIALAGPLVNLCCAVICVALWWLFPVCYAFTYTVAEANFALFAVNLLPAFPLDGGRVVYSFIAIRKNKKVARLTCVISGLILSGVLLAFFIISLYNKCNLSLLFFALFVLFGAVKKEEDGYIRSFDFHTEREYLRGMAVKITALSENATVKKLVSVLDFSCVNRVELYKSGQKVGTLEQGEIERLIVKNGIYTPIKDAIKGVKQDI